MCIGERKSLFTKTLCINVYCIYYSLSPKTKNDPNVTQLANGLTICEISLQWNKKE